MPSKPPNRWCRPHWAFGQLTDKDGQAITERVWHPPASESPEELAKFRAAVMQSAICLYVRTAKNNRPRPDPRLAGRTFPLSALADADKRGHDFEKWQGRLTGRYNLTMQDIVTIMDILPGALPSEPDIQTFIDVAQGRIAPPVGWGWPDTTA